MIFTWCQKNPVGFPKTSQRVLQLNKGDGQYGKCIAELAKTDVLILDGFGLSTLSENHRRYLFLITQTVNRNILSGFSSLTKIHYLTFHAKPLILSHQLYYLLNLEF